ncbi:Ion transport peptide-like protein, partial [Stegodyphus mimosarum]
MKTSFFVPLFLFFTVFVLASTSGQDIQDFNDLHCMGVYDKDKFSYVSRICDKCYDLFREEEVRTLCRSDCFKSSNFKQCVDALVLQDDQLILTQ